MTAKFTMIFFIGLWPLYKIKNQMLNETLEEIMGKLLENKGFILFPIAS